MRRQTLPGFRRLTLMRTFVQDLRYAARNLMKSRGFAAVAVLTLALGIGANTAIFSIIDAVLLRPLPYRNPDRLVRLYETEAAPGRYPFTGPDFIDWKTENSTFADMALFLWPRDMNLSRMGQADHVRGVPTEANFFSLLGVQPILGRAWAPGEDRPGKVQLEAERAEPGGLSEVPHENDAAQGVQNMRFLRWQGNCQNGRRDQVLTAVSRPSGQGSLTQRERLTDSLLFLC